MKKALSFFLAMIIMLGAVPVFSFASVDIRPRIIETVHPTDDVVVAEIVLTEAPYNADSTGTDDCTAVLQRAIDDCASAGGGTVFLPVGKYRLTSSVYIRNFVTVRGDWQDPDKGNSYGTVIVADVPSTDDVNPALFRVGGSAGASGLTVWYPNQSIDDVKAYPFTFYIDGKGSDYMLQSVINCTLINSYRGIGAGAEWQNKVSECHEMLTIENVKGTCLYQGLADYNSADVDTVKTLYFSGKYWSESGESFNAPDRAKLDKYTRGNLTAFLLGDLEWPEFADLKADSCKYGIHIVNGPRAAFSATFFNLFLTGCENGILSDEGSVMERKKQWGYSICNGTVEAANDALNDYTGGVVMLTNVKTEGKVKGRNIHTERASTDRYKLVYSYGYSKPDAKLYVVDADRSGRTDASAAVQATLSEASGGGIVYLPGGVYRFDSPVTVPDGVELRGISAVPNRDCSGNSSGTLILAYYGYESNDSPLITLGKESGLRGLRIVYPRNCLKDDSGAYTKTSPAVLSDRDGAYVTNCCIIQASEGIVCKNGKNIYLHRNVGCCFENFITIDSCSDVRIEGCLENGNALSRNGFDRLGLEDMNNQTTENHIFEYYFIPIGRKNVEYLRINNSTDVEILNTFIYGGKCFMKMKDSDILAVNIGSDGSAKNEATLQLSGGSATVIGMMNSTEDGHCTVYSHSVDGTKLKLYDRISVDLYYNEFTIFENINSDDLSYEDSLTNALQFLIKLYERIGRWWTVLKEK